MSNEFEKASKEKELVSLVAFLGILFKELWKFRYLIFEWDLKSRKFLIQSKSLNHMPARMECREEEKHESFCDKWETAQNVNTKTGVREIIWET